MQRIWQEHDWRSETNLGASGSSLSYLLCDSLTRFQALRGVSGPCEVGWSHELGGAISHTFTKYSLNTSYEPDTVLGAGELALNLESEELGSKPA